HTQAEVIGAVIYPERAKGQYGQRVLSDRRACAAAPGNTGPQHPARNDNDQQKSGSSNPPVRACRARPKRYSRFTNARFYGSAWTLFRMRTIPHSRFCRFCFPALILWRRLISLQRWLRVDIVNKRFQLIARIHLPLPPKTIG